MEDLLNKIEAAKMPAPSPIEQRWTCGSASHMSPASAAAEEGDSQDSLFSWVGIIMYLPTENERQRAAITKRWDLHTTSSPWACRVFELGCNALDSVQHQGCRDILI